MKSVVMRIKKNDLVEAKEIGLVDLFKGTGIILRGPYEEVVKLSNSPVNVSSVTLVVDVMAEGKVFKAIPIEYLERLHP
jgi:hypothetical protein